MTSSDFPDAESQRNFYSELQRRLARSPGVRNIALTSHFPGLGTSGYRFALEGESHDEGEVFPRARGAVVTPEFFDTFGVSVVDGRNFLFSDDASASPVIIVNRSFAARYFKDVSPLGRRLRFVGRPGTNQWWTIVGVAPDMAMNQRRPGSGMIVGDEAGFYIPFAQRPQLFMGIVLRTSGDPLALVTTVRETLLEMRPEQPLYDVNPLARAIH